jgi:hypothetical protein
MRNHQVLASIPTRSKSGNYRKGNRGNKKEFNKLQNKYLFRGRGVPTARNSPTPSKMLYAMYMRQSRK